MEKLLYNNIYIKNRNGSIIFDLDLYNWHTLICGDSGVGKSLLYQCIEAECESDNNDYAWKREKYTREKILLLDHSSERVMGRIEEAKEKLIIIDNYDSLMRSNDKLPKRIRSDVSNQYIIIGRHFESLGLSGDCIADLVFDNGVKKLDYSW